MLRLKEDFEEFVGPPIKPPEEPLEIVETRAECAIEIPEVGPRCQHPDERYKRPSFPPPLKERRSDDTSKEEEADEDFFEVFPHLNENHKPPPSKLPPRRRRGTRYFAQKFLSFFHIKKTSDFRRVYLFTGLARLARR